MIKFPSIKQFRDVIREVRELHDYQGKDETGNPVYLHNSDYPVLSFKGTVKVHGTNAAIVKYKDKIQFQSRERVLGLKNDNAKFMLTMFNKDIDSLFNGIEFDKYIAVFGEWCGKGIQKGVAVSELDLMFIVFAVQIDGVWQNINQLETKKEQGIYNINQFPVYQIEVDFNKPEEAQNKLIEITTEVENECPVGAYFNVKGIGEGIVWEAFHEEHRLVFKVKGEKHCSSKIKKLASVDVEKLEGINNFIKYAVTENRLNQGLENVDLNIKNTGKFIDWVVKDILKEETDVITENQINMKRANGEIASKAKYFFLSKL